MPLRVPEQFNAQWWERADFWVDLYEQVTETITVGAVVQVPVEVDAEQLTSPVDFTITAP